MQLFKRSKRRSKSSDVAVPAFDRKTMTKLMVIAPATLLLAYCAGKEAVVGITRVRNPDVAVMADPGDARALAQIAARLVVKPETRDQAVMLAKKALQRQALTPMALGVLATAALENGDMQQAENYIRMSRKISRRDELTNLQAVEIAGRKGDVRSVLDNYDIALRTTDDLKAQLMPRLVKAMELPEFETHFIRLARTRPPWIPELVALAAETTENPAQVARLLIASGGLQAHPLTAQTQSAMLLRLESAREWAVLRSYYQSLPGADRNLLTTTRFSPKAADPRISPLSWTFVKDGSAEAAFYSLGGGRQALSGIVSSGARVAIAHKLLFLSHGQYGVRVKTGGFEAGRNASAQMAILCVSKQADILALEIDLRKGQQMARFQLPTGCVAQRIEFRMAGGDGQQGAELRVESVDITR